MQSFVSIFFISKTFVFFFIANMQQALQLSNKMCLDCLIFEKIFRIKSGRIIIFLEGEKNA